MQLKENSTRFGKNLDNGSLSISLDIALLESCGNDTA